MGIMFHCFAVFCRQIYDVTDEVATNAYEDFWGTLRQNTGVVENTPSQQDESYIGLVESFIQGVEGKRASQTDDERVSFRRHAFLYPGLLAHTDWDAFNAARDLGSLVKDPIHFLFILTAMWSSDAAGFLHGQDAELPSASPGSVKYGVQVRMSHERLASIVHMTLPWTHRAWDEVFTSDRPSACGDIVKARPLDPPNCLAPPLNPNPTASPPLSHPHHHHHPRITESGQWI